MARSLRRDDFSFSTEKGRSNCANCIIDEGGFRAAAEILERPGDGSLRTVRLAMNEFDYQRTVIAYHGCDSSTLDKVLSHGGKLQNSENAYDWLGTGIYFWEHGPQRAWDWARWRAAAGSKTIKEPAVLGAVLHLGACFDLLDTTNTALLGALYPEFEKACQQEGKEVPVNKAPKEGNSDDLVLRYLDCAVINWILATVEKKGLRYDTVRCAFSEGGPAFPGARILLQSHIQITVRNPAVIVGYFLPAIDFGAKKAD